MNPSDRQRLILTQAQALGSLDPGGGFDHAVKLLAETPGNIVVAGLGKSGLVGAKTAATMASLGLPAFFVHAADAFHGDLGRFAADDIAVLLSHSGSTREVVDLAQRLRERGTTIVALTSAVESPLATLADAAVAYGPIDEACPLGLAPTTSTTVTLVLGDALSILAAEARGLTETSYWHNHPKGSLGSAGLSCLDPTRYRVGENLALINEATPIRDAFVRSEQEAVPLRRPGAIVVADAEQRLLGLFTDGDLRRALLDAGPSVWEEPIGRHMTRSPRRLHRDERVREAQKIFEQYRIDELPIVDDEQRVLALLDVQDLIALSLPLP